LFEAGVSRNRAIGKPRGECLSLPVHSEFKAGGCDANGFVIGENRRFDIVPIEPSAHVAHKSCQIIRAKLYTD
jgi:hypothetical protein